MGRSNGSDALFFGFYLGEVNEMDHRSATSKWSNVRRDLAQTLAAIEWFFERLGTAVLGTRSRGNQAV